MNPSLEQGTSATATDDHSLDLTQFFSAPFPRPPSPWNSSPTTTALTSRSLLSDPPCRKQPLRHPDSPSPVRICGPSSGVYEMPLAARPGIGLFAKTLGNKPYPIFFHVRVTSDPRPEGEIARRTAGGNFARPRDRIRGLRFRGTIRSH